VLINVHGHLLPRNVWSDKHWDLLASQVASSLNLPKETVFEQMLPQIWNIDAERLVEVMDSAGIDKAMIMGVDFGMSWVGEAPWSVEEMNHYIAKQVEEYPDKLAGICGVDPRRGERAIKILEKAVEEWGMVAVKIWPVTGFYPDDREFWPFYEKCVELGVPVHSHTASVIFPGQESKWADPIYLDGVASHFPDLKIVMVHFGAPNWTYKCVGIMSGRPNVYVEISGHQTFAAAMPQRWLSDLRYYLNIPSVSAGRSIGDRIMFGTDWPLGVQLALIGLSEEVWVDWVKKIPEKGKEYGLKFTQEEVKKILSDNAKKIHKL